MPRQKRTLIAALILALILLAIFYANTLTSHPAEQDKETTTIHLDSLSLRQKIAQMIITYGERQNREDLQRMMVGGIYVENASSKEEAETLIGEFQRNASIPFLVAADMEGCKNPFEAFYISRQLADINTAEEALNLGIEHGRLLKETGISINFAPVADLRDDIWKCRSFPGTAQEVAEKAGAYITGLQAQGVMATAKHYPGKTLSIKDPHKEVVQATITESDLEPFRKAITAKVSAIMVSHLIVNGSANSEGKPASTSQKLISGLRSGFPGLIITDEIGMDGLESYYREDRQRFADVFNSGADIVIYFDKDAGNVEKLITEIEDAVTRGEINESRIDAAAARILKAKGLSEKQIATGKKQTPQQE